MDALDAHELLAILVDERDLARADGRLADAAYAEALEEEISACRQLFVEAAVTEVATLHGVLFGRHQG